jgi:hypothetical protein
MRENDQRTFALASKGNSGAGMALKSIVAMIFVAFFNYSTTCEAARDDRFPQSPADLLLDPSNLLLRYALDQNKQSLEGFENSVLWRGKFKDPAEQIDYAVALLAIGKSREAEDQLSAAEKGRSPTARLLKFVQLIKSLVLLKEGSFYTASRVLSKACSSGIDARDLRQAGY